MVGFGGICLFFLVVVIVVVVVIDVSFFFMGLFFVIVMLCVIFVVLWIYKLNGNVLFILGLIIFILFLGFVMLVGLFWVICFWDVEMLGSILGVSVGIVLLFLF